MSAKSRNNHIKEGLSAIQIVPKDMRHVFRDLADDSVVHDAVFRVRLIPNLK
jgi:hypothetical protein